MFSRHSGYNYTHSPIFWCLTPFVGHGRISEWHCPVHCKYEFFFSFSYYPCITCRCKVFYSIPFINIVVWTVISFQCMHNSSIIANVEWLCSYCTYCQNCIWIFRIMYKSHTLASYNFKLDAPILLAASYTIVQGKFRQIYYCSNEWLHSGNLIKSPSDLKTTKCRH